MSYVKHSDVSDSIAHIVSSIEQEPNVQQRKLLISNYIKTASSQLVKPLARLCFELKVAGEPTDVIATELGISRRAVIRLIRKWAADNGIRNPLDNIEVNGFFDIRDHVDM